MASWAARTLPQLRGVVASAAFCQAVPKLDVHAHMNGSIRAQTLLELARAGKLPEDAMRLIADDDRDLAGCFRLFGIIHQIVRDAAALERIASEVVEDFARENVVYLELRTTPRAVPETGLTAAGYVEAVLRGLRKGLATWGHQIDATLILSVNRAMSLDEAQEVVTLAHRFQLAPASEEPTGVVGVDFSGNPTINSFVHFLPAFDRARVLGLHAAVHFAEVHDESDSAGVLDWRPERVGHACCMTPARLRQLLAQRTPVEICATSNMRTLNLAALREHPTLGTLLQADHPVLVCTDDRGVFATSTSEELHRVAEAFALPAQRVAALALAGIHHTFAPAPMKARVTARVQQAMRRAVATFGAAGDAELPDIAEAIAGAELAAASAEATLRESASDERVAAEVRA